MIQIKELTKLESFLPLIYDLQEETWPHDHLSKKEVFEKIIQLAQILGVNLSPDDPEFLPIMILKIKEISFQPPEQEAPSIPPNLSEFVEDYDKAKKEQEEEIKKKLGSQENYSHYQKLENGLKKFIVVSTDFKIPEELAKRIAESAVDKIITSLPPVAQPEFFPEEDKEQILKEAKEIVDKEVKKVIREEVVLKEAEEIVGKEAEKIQKQREEALNEFKKIIEAEAIKIAAKPEIIEAIKERQPVKKTPIDLKKLSLPPEIVKQIESQVIKETYSPFKTILDPQASLALTKRTFYTLQAKAIQMKVAEMQIPPDQKEVFERFKKMVYQGLFKEDLQTTSEFLKKLGLPENHPAFNYLNSEIGAFDEIQKVDIKNWLGKIVGRGDRPYIKILKKYYDYVKKTGKWQVFDKNLNVFLKLSPNVLWANKKGYSFFVKKLVDKFQFLPNLYQKTFRFITRGNYNSLGAWTQKFVYGKVLKPLFAKIGQTAAGQAVKTGIKKAAGWLAVKVGLKAGIWAAAAGTAAPSFGISLLIAAAVEIGTRLLGKIWDKVKTIIRDPEKALMAIGAGILALVFIPMPFALIAILPLTIGGLGLMSFIAAPATLGAVGGGVGAFFTAIAVIPIAAPIALFVIILFSVLAGLTLFIVLVVSGAFILPSKMAEVTPTTISPYESDFFTLTKTASATHLENNQLPSKVIYTITLSPKGNYILNHPQIREEITVFKESSIPSIAPCNFEGENDLSILTTSKTLTCEKTFDNRFNDSEIINTIKISTGVEGQIGLQQGIAIATITIGNPPMDCPSGWPTTGRISQGPEGVTSHGPHNEEAIDIGNNQGTPVYATHKGIAIVKRQDIGGGFYVVISGTCESQVFQTEYFHLLEYGRVSGPVNRGQLIGYMDSSGGPYASHLHYEFMSTSGFLRMEPPYIPISLPSRSCDSSAQCYTIATGP